MGGGYACGTCGMCGMCGMCRMRGMRAWVPWVGCMCCVWRRIERTIEHAVRCDQEPPHQSGGKPMNTLRQMGLSPSPSFVSPLYLPLPPKPSLPLPLLHFPVKARRMLREVFHRKAIAGKVEVLGNTVKRIHRIGFTYISNTLDRWNSS